MQYVKKFFVVFGLFLFSQLGMTAFGFFKGMSLSKGEVSLPLISVTIVLVVVILNISGMISLGKLLKLSDFKFSIFDKKNMAIIFGGFILARVSVIFFAWLLSLQDINNTANDETINLLFTGESPLLIFMLIAISAPIVEEIVFRGGIIGYLFKEHQIIGIAVSSVLFGLIHSPSDLISFALYGSMGLILSLAYYKTKRLEVSIGIHFLNNLLATLAMFFWT